MKKSLIIGIGSNLGDKLINLKKAKEELSKKFNFIAESTIYESKPVDYIKQPFFYNQAIEFTLESNIGPLKVLDTISKIEKDLGRERDISKGPRIIDIDILFYGCDKINYDSLIIPHPEVMNRSFTVKPLKELPYYSVLKNNFSFPKKINNYCKPIISINSSMQKK